MRAHKNVRCASAKLLGMRLWRRNKLDMRSQKDDERACIDMTYARAKLLDMSVRKNMMGARV